jgi:methionyl-tRNA formyltransferase
VAIVFLGTSDFAAAVLGRLAESGEHRPALVLTRPDRPSGRGRRLTAPPVAERARELGIPLEQPESVNDPEARELIAHAHERAGDGSVPRSSPLPGQRQTLVVCAFGALIKEPLLSEHDILNLHPSLLPRWRGAAPVERAIMAGDEQTGVSIMRLTAGLDSGPVCLTGALSILAEDTYGTLSVRLQELGAELLLRALGESLPFTEQASEGVTYAEKVGAEDRLLDPDRPAVELERVVRALHPHVGARVQLDDGSLLGVRRAALIAGGPGGGDPAGGAGDSGEPGAARSPGLGAEGDRLLLHASPGTLELLSVQPPGGREMDAAAYLRGHGPPGRR